MTKIEFLATSLPSGLKVNICYFNGCADTKCVKLIGRDLDNDLNADYKVIPIIRHLDTLTQECVQADYNNGEPFIPIVELAKIAFPDEEWQLHNSEKEAISFQDSGWHGEFWYDEEYCIILMCGLGHFINQLQLFQQLIRWHYWPNKPENEEVVYVTETFNPYK